MKVLIVDDQPLNLKLLRVRLEAEGHFVLEASDGMDALDVLNREHVDAVISDILMPRMDGYGLCCEVRKQTKFKHLPFIITSSTYKSVSDEKLALDMGADKYLRNPVSAIELAAALGEVTEMPLERHHEANLAIPEAELMREYSERLVNKLEEKNIKLLGALERLQVSEERQRKIFETEPECVTVISPEGRLLEVNPAGLAMLEADTLGQVYDKAVLDFVTSGYRTAFTQLHERVMLGESGTLEFQIVSLKGTRRWLEVHAAPLCDEQGEIISLLGITRDITVRKESDALIKERERQLSTLMDNLPGLAYRCLNDAAYTAEFVSDGVAELTGFPAGEFRQHRQHMRALIHPDDQGLVRTKIQMALENKQPFELTYRIHTAAGAEKWVWEKGQGIPDDRGDLHTLEGFVTDVTERKRAEEQVRESEARFRQLAENIEEVFWISDSVKNQIIYVSPAYESIFGRTCESLYAAPQTWLGAIHPEDQERILDATLTKQSRGDYDETYRILKPDGSMHWIRDRAFPLRHSTGEVYRVVGTATDVTDARTLEEQLRQSQKMDAIGRLSGGIAHDFNNILCVILGYASILQHEELSTEGSADALNQIANAGERAANLTRQLLIFSRQQVMQSRPIELNDVTANMTKMLQRLIGENIVLQTSYASAGAKVLADSGMMEQVLLNLIVNARDAMPEGGEISIRTERVRLDGIGPGQRPNPPSNEFIRLSVRDTGCGIPNEILPRVFEPFFTTKETGKGTGLGLATVFGIVEQHQGWIEMESEVGRGTTFNVFLPRLPDAVAQLPGQQGPVRVNGGHETILVVEDEASIRTLTRHTLERYGYCVHEAGSGPAALALWRQEHQTVDLLLTDIVMPGGLSGSELAAQLLAEKPQLKLIYTSGYPGDVAGLGVALREGINFLQKPYSPIKLAEIVRYSLDAK